MKNKTPEYIAGINACREGKTFQEALRGTILTKRQISMMERGWKFARCSMRHSEWEMARAMYRRSVTKKSYSVIIRSEHDFRVRAETPEKAYEIAEHLFWNHGEVHSVELEEPQIDELAEDA